MLFHCLKLQCQFICFATHSEGFYSWPQRRCECVVVGNCNSGIFQLPLGVAVTSPSLLDISMFWGGWKEVYAHIPEIIWMSFGSFGSEKWRTRYTVQTARHHLSHFRGALADTSFLCFCMAPVHAKSHHQEFLNRKEQAKGGVELLHPTKHRNHYIASLRSVPPWRKNITFVHKRPVTSVPGPSSKRTGIPPTM